MSFPSNSGAIREDAVSAKERHRQLELPQQRGLACRACRKKKHLCDRRKPSCTGCSTSKIECIYPGRKLRATVSELEDVLQKLERKYKSYLKATKERTEKAAKPSAFATADDETSSLADRLVAGPPELDSLLHFYISKLKTTQITVPYGGYHFDETFLAMSPHDSKASSLETYTVPSACSLKISTPNPTRIFSYVPRYPLAPSIYLPNLGGISFRLEPPPLEAETSKVQSTAAALPLNSLTSTSPEVWNECQPNAYEECSSLELAFKPPHKIPEAQTPSTIEITPSPTLQFSRASWWDYLTSTYILHPTNTPIATSISRHDAVLEISRDVYEFFQSAPVWLSFINVPLFFDMFYHTELRSAIQPCLVLSILAYSKLLQTDGETKKKNPGAHERSLRQSVMLRDLAQASFEASYNAGWIDLPLAQAAWILVLYEISAHPNCTSHRMQSAMALLDNVIHALGLTSLDALDPHAAIFVLDKVPALGRPPPNGARYPAVHLAGRSVIDRPTTTSSTSPSSRAVFAKYRATPFPTPFDDWRSLVDPPQIRSDHELRDDPSCPCQSLSLAGSPDALRCTPTWDSMPRWAPNATWAEIRKEEGRRLVWSALVMLGQDAAVRQAGGMPQLDLYVSKPENIALLFPGEEIYASLPDVDTTYSGKESLWALWSRTMLLWFACIRHVSRGRPHTPLPGFSVPPLSLTNYDTVGYTDADFAMRVWMETVAIENALDSHSCTTERALMYQPREFLFIIRMQVSRGFRYSIPKAQTGINFSQLDRDLALKWIRHRHSIGTALETIIAGDPESPGRKMLLTRSFPVYLILMTEWRALELWKLDHSLLLAVEVALMYRRILRWYQQVWPCEEIQRWAAATLGKLKSICDILGKDVE
ncbi:hypothetical protein FRB93_001227 [Tulasnella sp. JGI-2019a]|nr:hypothetical protein FRB93_001227 [Tulasnella sp. JGI-2019a]